MKQLSLPHISPIYRLKVERDTVPGRPRADYDHLGTMVCWHRNYNLGDEQPRCSPDEYLYNLAEQAEPRAFINGEPSEEKIEKILAKHYIMLPLYLYDHSGITMNTSGFSCRWDSGQVGFIYVSVTDVRAYYGWNVLTAKRRKQIEDHLQAEVEEYDHYLTGEVYGFVLEKYLPVIDEWEDVESCWGFYGEKYAVSYLKDYITHCGFTNDQIDEAMRELGTWVQSAHNVI